MGTLSFVSEYLKDLEECMDDGDSRVAKEVKLFDVLEHKSVMIEFKDDFVVLDYVNEEEPYMLFGRDFLETIKSQVDFGLEEIRMNLTKFEEGIDVIGFLEEVGSSSEEGVKIGKSNHDKGYNITKITPPPSLRLEEILPISAIPPQPIYHPLNLKQKEKMKEVLDIKYKELEESKPILEVLENYVINYDLPMKINGVVETVALVDTEASVSVLPYSLYKDLVIGDLSPYQTNLTMVDNTQAKAMGEVKNVRIQLGYQSYMVNLLILDILMDPVLPLLLGRPFLRTCGDIIDIGRGEDDWLGSFKVGRDKDGNVKYGSVTDSFIDIEDDMERVIWDIQKVDGDGNYHARFEIVMPSERRFNRAFKTKTTTRKLSGKFKTEDVLKFSHFLD
nr:hypothetical protein [Tanacetum cinerariifolium]